MEAIGSLAKRFGIARSTLLHYDRIGLLTPSERSKSGYRLYASKDARQLEVILEYRRAGLPTAEIKGLLNAETGAIQQALTHRLKEINADIEHLREQQRFILGILRSPEAQANIGVMNKKTWTDLLQASGFDEKDMMRWHGEFERTAPKRHQEFLEFLCIPPDEIESIRRVSVRWSRSAICPKTP
ncbi:MerR family transcriptional regulator [Desulfovibrio ferrophilus]|uniref:Putative transcriptional regulator n=1 Tax=Desulfovibrio ferrophilus TaxID=241368 RepID=A0A2Z6AVN5_9BACT|nr:MerR family DNA-binding transcriptional regulator [Desulfovibrio ferrophilus]BBD07291.1 putative transcriptional regulator [Desulfovibrio ferrophilus]